MLVHNKNIKEILGLTCLLLIISSGQASFGRGYFFMEKIKIAKGDRFGKLSVIKEVKPKLIKKGKYTEAIRCVQCKCDCGNVVITSFSYLRIGHTKSCGCLQRSISSAIGKLRKTHGFSRTPLYRVYSDMKSRCSNSNHPEYHNYGGRGIRVCDDWIADYLVFHTWAMSNGYKKGLEIDRQDNNRGYSSDNCRWVTRIINCYNQRVTFMVEWEGEKISLGELCSRLKLNRNRIYQRIQRDGMSVEEAVNRPYRNYPKINTNVTRI